MSSAPPNRPPRVLLIAPQPFFEVRGTPMNVRQMCRVLTGAGYRVDLATYPLGQPVAMPGLEIHRCLRLPGIRSVPIGFSWRKVALDLTLFWTVLRLLICRRYTVVHATEEGVFLALPFTIFGARVIYDLDSLLSEQLRYSGVIESPLLLGWVRALERLALRRSAGAIAVCRSIAEAARRFHPEVRVFQVEDAPMAESLRDPDPQRVAALRSELGLDGQRLVVYTGNLESYQGIDLLIDASHAVRERIPNARIVVVGGGETRLRRLRRALRRDGLEGAVLTVGRRPPDEMPEWMGLAEVLVSPRSEGDNTPLKIYTYMHSGTPIVATDRPTHTQVLDESTAFLGKPTPESFAGALCAALADPEDGRRRAEAALQLAEAEYSPQAFERKLLDAYEDLLGSP